MVRGTYLPWPVAGVSHCHNVTLNLALTGLGEEGAEALVRVRGLALGGEVAVGLLMMLTVSAERR